MRVFVTGASGYLGSALVRRLAGDGHHVVALVRPTSDTAALVAAGAELAQGDITDRYSMREGMAGADWVVHAAAYVQIDGPLDEMAQVNVEGSENVASLAYKLGVGRLLSISSIAAFGGSPADGTPADEETPPRLPFPSPYSATKHAGQERIEAWAERGLVVNTVYPSLVYGPPGKKSGANFLLYMILKRRLPALIGADRKAGWVFVDDVVDGMVRVMEGAEPGRGYILAGETVRLGELVAEVCRLGGVAPPRLSLPVWLAPGLAAVSAPLARLAGRRPPLARGQVRSLVRHWAFDDSRARRELGWAPRPLAQGLPPTVAYLQNRS